MKLLVPLALLASTAAALPLPLATGNVADLYSIIGPSKERRTVANLERRYLFFPEIFFKRDTAEPERRDAETEDFPTGFGYNTRTTEDPDGSIYHARATEDPDGIIYHGRATEGKRMQNQKRASAVANKRETEDPDMIVVHGRTTPERRNPMNNQRAPPSIPYHGRAAEDPDSLFHGARATETSCSQCHRFRARDDPDAIIYHGRATEKRMQNQKREIADSDMATYGGRSTAPPWRRTTETPERDLEEDDTTGWAKRTAMAEREEEEEDTTGWAKRELEEEDTTGWAKRELEEEDTAGWAKRELEEEDTTGWAK